MSALGEGSTTVDASWFVARIKSVVLTDDSER